MNIIDPAEACTELGAEQQLGEGAGVILWPLGVIGVIGVVALLAVLL